MKSQNEGEEERVDQEKIYKLACSLIQYEADEPHIELPHIRIDEDDQWYPDYTVEDLEEHLNEEHHGDCINLPVTCMRCTAELAVDKAKYILRNTDL